MSIGKYNKALCNFFATVIGTIIFMLFGVSHLFAANYYISNTGSDANNGRTAATPWQTISNVNTYFSSFSPGDSILFKRGNTFYGTITINQSGTDGKPITISAYGAGAKPIITGFTTISGWTNEGGGIYSKLLSSESLTNMVTIDGKQFGMGRYPDNGFLTYESFSANTSISDTELENSPNWTGADIAIRKNDWTLDRGTITNHTGSLLTYNTNFTGSKQTPARSGFGYFILNDLKTLTTYGEWYHNIDNGKFYMYFGERDPLTKFVQIATINDLVISTVGHDYITLDNLNLIGSINNAVFFKKISSTDIDDYCKIQSCDISFCGKNGIELGQGAGFIVAGSTINYCNSYGIYSFYASQFTINDNKISNIAVIPGQSISDQGNGGIYFSCNNGIISYNKIKNTGYNGIFIRPGTLGKSINISYNYIDSVCLVLNDGGAIYTNNDWDGIRTIDHNIINNVIGNGAGAILQKSLSEGIYLDEYSSHLVVTNNTVANSGNSGIKLHKAHDNTIKDNTIFNCKTGIDMQNSSVIADYIRGITLSHNIFFAKTAEQSVLYFHTKNNDDITLFGIADSNYYARPIDDNLLFKLSQPALGTIVKDLSSWQAFSQQDTHSKKLPFTITKLDDILFRFNPTKDAKTIPLDAKYKSVDGKIVKGSITLQPFCSVILMKDEYMGKENIINQ